MIYKTKVLSSKLLNKLKLIMIISLFMLFSCQNQDDKTNDFNILEQSVTEIQKGYKNGDFSIKEVTLAYLNRINEIDKNGPALNSIIQINPDAIKIAEQLDKEMSEGKTRGPLHGIPVLLKDNIDTHDKMPTTCGSRALANSFPLKDSHIAKQLREAGAIILGKANLSEWANVRGESSTSGWSGVGGLTKNPYILDRNPCGSSSGSAVAVSANLTMLAIGTETTGSIICPAQTNGIVGIKPTVGLLSRSGIIPVSYSLDTPGPMARTVRDAAILLGALVGVDSTDEKTLQNKRIAYSDYTQFLKENGIKGKRIGFYKSTVGINTKVDSLMLKAIDYLKSQGAEIIEIDEIASSEMRSLSIQVMLYEYQAGLNKYFKSLGSDAPIKNLEELIAFNKLDSIELKYFNQKYLEMTQAMGDLPIEVYKEVLSKLIEGSREQGIDKVMNLYKLDAIVGMSGAPAWKTDLLKGDNYSNRIDTSSPSALAGYPNITVPMGFVGELPVGISFFGRAWSEPLLLEIAYAYEIGTKQRKIPKFMLSD